MDAAWKQTLEILTDVKALAHELHSPRLEYLGIAAVMSSFCKEFGERKRVGVDFRSDGLPSAIPSEISLCLFRVLQEALYNAVQHSGVRQVDARLWGTSDQIQLTVSDFGVGFNLKEGRQDGGLGINRMQERLKAGEGKPFHRLATQTRYDGLRSRSCQFGKRFHAFSQARILIRDCPHISSANSPTEPFSPSIKRLN